MSGDVKSSEDTVFDQEGLALRGSVTSAGESSESQLVEADGGWNELDSSDKAQKEMILKEHFLKALERFNAGVSLVKIRRHYEKLGAKYSPVTFRKKWDELVKMHAEHG